MAGGLRESLAPKRKELGTARVSDAQWCARPIRDGAQKRVRMPIVPTIWFGVLDAPPDPLMNAW